MKKSVNFHVNAKKSSEHKVFRHAHKAPIWYQIYIFQRSMEKEKDFFDYNQKQTLDFKYPSKAEMEKFFKEKDSGSSSEEDEPTTRTQKSYLFIKTNTPLVQSI